MAKLTTTQTFADGEQVSSTKLNAIISGATLAGDSVDGITIEQTAGVLSAGVMAAANLGANSVTTVKILDANVTTAKLADDAVTEAKLADDAVSAAKIPAASVAYAKTLTADRAVQADMQSETASHFVAPDVLKYHPGIAKAGGIVAFPTAGATLTGGYNVTSAVDSAANERTITLAVTMANTNYRVHCTYEDDSTVAAVPPICVIDKTTTTFIIRASEAATNRRVAFTVFGTLA